MTALRPSANPFRTAQIDQLRYRLTGTTWDELLARFDALGRRGAVVGDHGAGKTRFLATLAAELTARGVAVTALRATRAPLPDRAALRGRIALVDELDGLPWWRRARWWRALADADGAVVALHATSRRLPTWHRCVPDPGLIATLIEELTGAGAPADLATLLAEACGNVRNVFRQLYDRAGERRGR